MGRAPRHELRVTSGWKRATVVVCGLVAVLATACGSSPGRPSGTTSPRGGGTAPSTGSTPKPLITGFIDKGSEGPYHLSQPFPVTSTAEVADYPEAFGGIVVNVTWAQLEPAQGRFDFSPLQRSLAAVAAYNATPGHTALGVKLRVWGGFTAPAWAKSLGGSPLTVAGTSGASPGGTLGRWWTRDYQQEWTDLQTALADNFDDNALLREVAVTSCATATAEPFIITRAVIAAALPAGWSSADQQQCLDGALGSYAAWHRTAVDFTFNVFTEVSSTGARSPDFAVTSAVMTACATSSPPKGQPRCILDNHGLTDTVVPGQAQVYSQIDSLWQEHGTPVTFQTVSPGGFSLCQAVGVATAHHARSVEIWPPGTGFTGYSQYPAAELTTWSTDLAAGTAPTCS